MTEIIEEFKRQMWNPELPDLGPGPRAGVLPAAALNRLVDSFLGQSKFSSARGALIRSLALLWHDHLEAAHQIAQNIENDDGSFVHGIVHRREPDYGNAKYWFRRIGKHPCFQKLAQSVGPFLESNQDHQWAAKLIRNGEWDSFAFIDACEQVSGRAEPDPWRQSLREIQRMEFDALLEYFCRRE